MRYIPKSESFDRRGQGEKLYCIIAGSAVISDRISRLRENEKLEEAARAVLKHLGELKGPYLTEVEEKLLSVIEKEYGIIDDEIPRNFQSTKD